MAPLEAAKSNPTLADLLNPRQDGEFDEYRAGIRDFAELCSAILRQRVAEFMAVLPAGDFDLHLPGEDSQVGHALSSGIPPARTPR
jgi:hypothetical protein